jgi:CRP/FNR family cyclic AMP-dependent transcriptional regulator
VRGPTEGSEQVAKRGLAVIERVPIFQGLTKPQLRNVRDLSDEVRYMQGATIVKQGDPGETFYVILEGEAKVTVKNRKVASLYPGDFFGEISLLDPGPRTASVVAQTPVFLLELTRKKFFKMLDREPVMALRIGERLAQRLRELDRRVNA